MLILQTEKIPNESSVTEQSTIIKDLRGARINKRIFDQKGEEIARYTVSL